MPKVNLHLDSNHSPKDTYDRVNKFLENDKDLKKLDPSYVCQFDPAAMKGTAKGKLFSAQLQISPKAQGASVDITVDLPMTLALAKGMVQKTLQKKLDQSLA
jgi:hypothetical protein